MPTLFFAIASLMLLASHVSHDGRRPSKCPCKEKAQESTLATIYWSPDTKHNDRVKRDGNGDRV